MLRLRSLYTITLLMCTLLTYAQTDDVFTGNPEYKPKATSKSEWVKNCRGGLNFQIWPGNPFFVYLAPHLGYSPIENFEAGLSFNYSHTRYLHYFGTTRRTVVGPGVYTQYTFNSSCFIRAQFDRMYQPDYTSLEPGKFTWVNYATVGFGFKQNLSENMSLNSLLLYNFTPSPLSIFQNRVILQFGISASFSSN